MNNVFRLASVGTQEESEVVDQLVSFAWDGAIAIAREGNDLVVDFGELGADAGRVAELTGRRVRVSEDRPKLAWSTVYDPNLQN